MTDPLPDPFAATSAAWPAGVTPPRTLVINPPRVDGCTVVREERFEHRDIGSCYPPLSHLQVAAALEAAGVPVTLVDAMGPDLSWEETAARIDAARPEVVFARVAFDCQGPDSRVFAHARSRHGALTVARCKIVAEADAVLDQYLREHPYVDLFVLAEPDAVVVDVVRARAEGRPWSDVPGIAYREGGAIRRTAIPEPPADLDTFPRPAWHLLPTLEPYHTGVLPPPFAIVQTTRGCPFQCRFCAYRRNRIRYHSAERVLDELRWLKASRGLRSFLLFDDVVGLQKGRFEALLRGLIEARLGLKWACCTRADLLTEEQARLMKRAGCVEVAIGVESGAPAVLELAQKGVSLPDIERAARIVKSHRMLFYAMCILGLPGETRETVRETYRFIRRIDPFYTQFCFSTPLPNTPNYAWYKERGFLLTEDWSKYSSLYPDPVVRTEGMTAADLAEMRAWIYRKLLFRPWYLLKKIRPFDWRWNVEGARKIWQRMRAVHSGRAVR
jgi:radical SAM superfamily enzyme YgiQ (UPF0313 family)